MKRLKLYINFLFLALTFSSLNAQSVSTFENIMIEINDVGNAKYGDVLGLVRNVRTHVDKAFKLELVPEVELLGLKWENII